MRCIYCTSLNPVVGCNSNSHSTAGSDGVYSFPHVAIELPQASSSVNLHPSHHKPHDPTKLSSIAASATDLEARLPPADGGEQRQDQDQTVQSPAWDSQPSAALSKDSSLISSTTDPQVEDPVPVRVLPPAAPRPLPNRPHINPQLEPRSASEQHHRVLDRSHGRAQKVRGKFTDSRRQEVQEIRKRGACIRCRMLRKTVCNLSHPIPMGLL